MTITADFEKDFITKLHPVLADSLITNLLGNAIKYNYSGSSIHIDISANKYHLSNTSMLEAIPQDKLFKRMFASKNNRERSNGLGLTIVKKIADVNKLHITYYEQKGEHVFELAV